MFCEHKDLSRWMALSGGRKDIYPTDQVIMELFPGDAGYEIAIDAAKGHGLKMPMLGKSS